MEGQEALKRCQKRACIKRVLSSHAYIPKANPPEDEWEDERENMDV